MIALDRFSHFRLGLSALYERERQARQGRATLNLLPLLAMPVPERVVILAKLDGATRGAIATALRVSAADAALSSPRMIEAVQSLKSCLDDPYCFIEPELVDWPSSRFAHHHGERIERRFLQWLFADVGVCLIGDGVPRSLMGLSLKDRMILYLLIVEGMERREIQAVLRCSEHAVKSAIHRLEVILAHAPIPQPKAINQTPQRRPHSTFLHVSLQA